MSVENFADDRAQLDRLEIENFKSYKGNVVIGPLRPFTAVIGPNGSGKSNFMDAISFVFGEQARSLRVKKLNELIHGSNINDPTGKTCSVTAVLKIGDTEKKFMRTVRVSSGTDATSEYRIDGKSVSNKQYIEALESHSIVIKPRNFLVFQGQVEMIATMDPKQRTQLIEKISGSGDLKDEYETLFKQHEEANEDMRKAFNNKKETAVEEKEAKEDKKAADDYEKRMKELEAKRSQLQQFELYHKEREMDDIRKEIRRQKQTLEEQERDRKDLEVNVKTAKAEFGEKVKALSQLDKERRAAEEEVAKARPEHTALKAKIDHLTTKIASEERMEESLSVTRDQLKSEIDRLEKDKDGVETAKTDFLEGFSQTSFDSQPLTQLNPEQMAEYHRLKKEASRRMAEETQEAEKAKTNFKKDQDNLAAERRQLEENLNQLQRKRKQHDQETQRLQRLKNHIEQSETERDKLQEQLDELKGSTENIEPRIAEIQLRLEAIASRLGEIRVDEREMARKAKKEDLINKLRMLYADDVLGRMIDLCHHSHERYQLAVTKILGKYLNSIVVTTKQVAQQCIAYMKQQEIDSEQFIPLDFIEAKPIQETMRNKDPDNLKLVYDVIQITHADKGSVQKALRFACGSAVTVKDDDYGRRLAYGRDRLQVVTWSGTLYDKSGIVSGGAQELRSRAKKWDEKELGKLRNEQKELADELRGLMMKRRKEEEIRSLEAQVSGKEKRLGYMEKDLKEAEKSITELQKEIEKLEEKEASLQERVSEAEQRLAESEKRKNRIQASLNTVEDDVFREFCEEVGVRNIRQYEAREESEKQERQNRLLEFETQIIKLTQKLINERQRLAQADEKVEKCARNITKLKADLEKAEGDEKKKQKIVEIAEEKLAELKGRHDELKEEVDEYEEKAEAAKKEFAALNKKIQALSRQIAGEETKREQLKLDRRAIFQYCKMHNIELPFERGTMEDISVAVALSSSQEGSGDSQVADSSQSSVVEEREANIKLDYSKLPERLKRQMDGTEHKKEVDRIQKEVKDLENAMDKINLPKANAGERLNDIKNKMRQTTRDLDDSRERVLDLSNKFDQCKKQRLKLFTECLETIASTIDTIYKELVDEPSAQAFLNTDNQESPFNGGVNLSLVVPGKNYRTIESLSGGEKTLASLSLLFAIHAAHPSPFFIMDEIDAALDNMNIARVAQFMRKKSREDFQIIIISLKEEMYQHVDALVGIYPEPGDVCISRNLTLDLNQFDQQQRQTRQRGEHRQSARVR